MSINTVRNHTKTLRRNDKESYNKMMAELALHDQTNFYQQTVCRFSEPHYNLQNVRSIVADIMIKYLPGFTQENFRENVLPELPAVPELEEA